MGEAAVRDKLSEIGQEQVLRFWGEIDEAGRARLVRQLEALDLDLIAELVETHVRARPRLEVPTTVAPVEAYPREPGEELRLFYEEATRRGHELLSAGKVGAILVAGGQGTRLGYDGPKGEFPVTPIKRKPLFRVFAEQLLGHSREAGRAIPWYVMTSEANDARTRAFFASHEFFGYASADVLFFEQGMMPAFGFDGKMLLAERDSLALSPDGHGGSLRALERSGALADMRRRGIEYVSYFQVDNPLAHTIDPLFLGLHDLTGSEMSSKTIPKAGPLERVGNFVVADGVLQVIEYSDLPEELARQTDERGALRFNSGSIAIHALGVSFVERLNRGGKLRLPWHRAEKKVPFVDDEGRPVEPAAPNAIKLEQFVFDAIPLTEHAIVYTTDRAEEYSPVKNAEGPDSPATSRRDQIRRAARWLAAAGVAIPTRDGEPDATIEISPLFAASEEQLRRRGAPVEAVRPGESLYIGEG